MPEDLDDKTVNDHLSRISTMWTVVFKAHEGSERTITAAQEQLLQRYRGAVYRYLFTIMRDVHAADELAQEFAVKIVRGSFKNADPQGGRFRDYVKATLFNLIRTYRKQQRKREPQVGQLAQEPATNPEPSEQEFLKSWRDELLQRSWESLQQEDQRSGRIYYRVLKYRVTNSAVSTKEMASLLGEQLGRDLSADTVRQVIHRARKRFSSLLFAEVSRSVETVSKETVEQELIDWGCTSIADTC